MADKLIIQEADQLTDKLAITDATGVTAVSNSSVTTFTVNGLDHTIPTVQANPRAANTATLGKIQVGNTIYGIEFAVTPGHITGASGMLDDMSNLSGSLTTGEKDVVRNKLSIEDPFSGDYADLTNTPSIPSTFSDLTGTIADSQIPSSIARDSELFSKDYADLTNTPTIPSITANPTAANTAVLSKVNVDGTVYGLDGFSGDYNDLVNKPVASSAPIERVTIANTTADSYIIPDGVDAVYGEIYRSDASGNKLQVETYHIPLVGDCQPPNATDFSSGSPFPVGYDGVLENATNDHNTTNNAYVRALWNSTSRVLRLQLYGGAVFNSRVWTRHPDIYYKQASHTITAAVATGQLPVQSNLIANTGADTFLIPTGVTEVFAQVTKTTPSTRISYNEIRIPLTGPSAPGATLTPPSYYHGFYDQHATGSNKNVLMYASWDSINRNLRLGIATGTPWEFNNKLHYHSTAVTSPPVSSPTSPAVATSGNDYVTVTLWKSANTTPSAPAARWRWDDGFQGSFDDWHTVRQAAVDAGTSGDPVYVAVGSSRRIKTTSGPYAYTDTPYVIRAEYDTQYFADGVLQSAQNNDTTHMRVREADGSWSPLWPIKNRPPNSWEMLLDSHGTYVINTSHSVNRTLPEEIDLADFQAIRMDVEPFGADYSVDKGAVLSGVIYRPDGGWKISTSTAALADNPTNDHNYTVVYDTYANSQLTAVRYTFPNQAPPFPSLQRSINTTWDGRVSSLVKRFGFKFHLHRPTLDGEKATNIIFHSYSASYTKVLIRFYGLRR